ncbi:hypothetical protein ACFU8R_14040 [Pseudonocardia alni]|uniref:hypothetical protein n=1 Tax=Pseudonocardia alni TaxID=33907 RepID=UPI00280BB066|nr:hypothetical protein [Pseudonocardia alni]
MNAFSPTPNPSPRHQNPSGRPVMATPAATPAPAAGPSLCCDQCGQPPADPLQQILMSAVWLIPGPDGPTTAHYCRTCPPSGPITDLTCLRCGDGPLLVGDLAADPAGPDDVLPAATQHWLTAAGWRLDGPVCPDCRPRR